MNFRVFFLTLCLVASFMMGCVDFDANYSTNCGVDALTLLPPGNDDNPNALPEPCGTAGLENQVTYPPPNNDSIYLRLQNSGRQMFYRVYGTPRGGGTPVELLPCTSTQHTFVSVTVPVPRNAYEKIIVGLGRDAIIDTNSKTDGSPNQIKISLYYRDPALDCGPPKQYVLINCDPNAVFNSWTERRGLDLDNPFPFPESPVRLMEIPPGIEPNIPPPTQLDPPERDTDTTKTGFFAEENFTITLTPEEINHRSESFDNNDKLTVLGLDIYTDPQKCTALTTLRRDDSRQPNAEPPRTGHRIKVAIIDSGADDQLLNNGWAYYFGNLDNTPAPLLAGHPVNGYKYRLGYDFIHADPFPEDELKHGTIVAAALAMNLPDNAPIDLLHYKMFDDTGGATYFGALTAIYAAVLAKVDIINLSWGIRMNESPRALRCAIEFARENGVLIVTSAGNRQEDIDRVPQWPAAFAADSTFWNVITVNSFQRSSLDANAPISRAEFSNYGQNSVNVAAFAAIKTYAWNDSLGGIVVNRNGIKYDVYKGTSVSTPLVSNQLALYLAKQSGPVSRSTVTDFLQTATNRRSALNVTARAAELPEFFILPACNSTSRP